MLKRVYLGLGNSASISMDIRKNEKPFKVAEKWAQNILWNTCPNFLFTAYFVNILSFLYFFF